MSNSPSLTAFSLLFGWLAYCLSGFVANAAQTGRPPNFVVIFADDLGYQDLGCFGSPDIRTPRLDAMAKAGMRFTSFYAQPVCGPSRAALMTGCYPLRVAERGNVKEVHPILHSDEVTVAEVLKTKGYATACFGKWDLAKHSQNGFFMDLFPTRQGFDYFFGTPTSNDAIVNLYRNEELIEPKSDMSTLTKRYTDEAIEFMEEHKDQPFFVYLPHTMPHTRLDASAQFKGNSRRGLYGDVVEEIDFNVGRILDAITEMRLTENTYVLFTSDNGPWLIKNKDLADGHLPADHGGSAGPLRSGKVSTWEGGVRVPTVLWGPGRVPAGTTCDKIASTLDILPTFAALAEADAPKDRVIDGDDIGHLFHGKFDKADPEKALFYYLRVHLQAVRQGKWKLHLVRDKRPIGAAPFADNRHIASADRVGFDEPFLVDLENDIGETTNVANQHPEVVEHLLALAESMREDLGDYDRVGKNMRFFDPIAPRPTKPPVPSVRKPRRTKTAGAKAEKTKVRARIHGKAGNLEGNLFLLNQWEEQPESIQQLYEAAYRVLAAAPNATFMDLARNSNIRQICKQAGIVHLGGPMLGSVTADGARVWLRTLQPAKVEVRVTVDGVDRSFGPVESTPETDLAAVVPVTGLAPRTVYPYRVLIDGQTIKIPSTAAITTAPCCEAAGKVRIAFGSCFHRWGLGNRKQADQIRGRKPAALLAIGDIAVQDRDNHLGLHRADYLQRDFQPAWQSLVAAIPVFATWDDHDYFNNDRFGIPRGFTDEDRIGVWHVFRHAWNNPSYGFGDNRRGIFLRTRIGSCDVIMVDERYFRTGQPGSFLGDEQMKWLEDQLLDCEGPFIILSCGTMWSDYVSNGKDSWGRWDPEGRERIFSLIEKNRIGGVLLISGDRHGARGFRIERPSGFNFYEFEAGSLGGRGGPPVIVPGSPQFYGIANQYAFGEFTIDAGLPDPVVEFRLISEDGTVIHKMKLARSQLTPPGE